jgi:hypothetical protein
MARTDGATAARIGLGIGVFTVTGEKVEERDYAGGKYSGTAKERPDGRITLALAFEVQPGVALVQGSVAQELPYTRHFNTADFGDGAPQKVAIPPGVVTVMIKRITDDFAPAATEGFTVAVAQRLIQES